MFFSGLHLKWVLWAPSQRVKLLGWEFDHSPQFSAEVRNQWSYTSVSPLCLHGLHWDNCVFCCLYWTSTELCGRFLRHSHNIISTCRGLLRRIGVRQVGWWVGLLQSRCSSVSAYCISAFHQVILIALVLFGTRVPFGDVMGVYAFRKRF